MTRERIAEARILIDAARYMVLNAAWKMDTVGNKVAKKEIAMIKVFAPNVACQVIDWAMQVHGGGGVTEDFGLAEAYAHARTLRFADGPDEVHRNQIAKIELGEQTSARGARQGEALVIIGVPREIKTHEYRVGLTPTSVRELVSHRHQVIVEKGAGTGIGAADASTRKPARASAIRGRPSSSSR